MYLYFDTYPSKMLYYNEDNNMMKRNHSKLISTMVPAVYIILLWLLLIYMNYIIGTTN